jgi:hypothetical protein
LIPQSKQARDDKAASTRISDESDFGGRDSRSEQREISRNAIIERCGIAIFGGKPVIDQEQMRVTVLGKHFRVEEITVIACRNERASMKEYEYPVGVLRLFSDNHCAANRFGLEPIDSSIWPDWMAVHGFEFFPGHLGAVARVDQIPLHRIEERPIFLAWHSSDPNQSHPCIHSAWLRRERDKEL